MHKAKSFIYVTNLQHGACLLFDRKGLGYRQSPMYKSNQLIDSSFHLFRTLQKHMHIQGAYAEQLRNN